MKKAGRRASLMIALLSVTLAISSVRYHRLNPTVVGNLCKVTSANPSGHCFKPLPAGGFPLSYIFDRGGVSVQNQLGVEDRFVWWRFGIDVLFYWIVAIVLAVAWRRYRSQS